MRRLLLTCAVVLGLSVIEVKAQHHEPETKGQAAQPKATAAEPKAHAAEPKAHAAAPKAAEPKAKAAEPKAHAPEPKGHAAAPKAVAAESKGHGEKAAPVKEEAESGQAGEKVTAPRSANELVERIGHVAVVIDSKRGRVRPARERLGIESKGAAESKGAVAPKGAVEPKGAAEPRSARDVRSSRVPSRESTSALHATPSGAVAADAERVAVQWSDRVELDWRVPLVTWPLEALRSPEARSPEAPRPGEAPRATEAALPRSGAHVSH